jgi:hypothetical protein
MGYPVCGGICRVCWLGGVVCGGFGRGWNCSVYTIPGNVCWFVSGMGVRSGCFNGLFGCVSERLLVQANLPSSFLLAQKC